MHSIFYLALLFIVISPIPAQNIINNAPEDNRVYTRIGIEPATMNTIGYQRNFQLGHFENRLTSYLEWSTAAFKFGWNNSELKIGGIFPLFEYGSFTILNDANASSGTASNINFKSNKFAVGDKVNIGWYKPVWFLASTIEYEKIYLNQITHTKSFKEKFYEDAVDGWYYGTGGNFQFGLAIGWTILKKVDTSFEVKLPVTEKFNAFGGSPLHVNMGLGYRF